jgi:integrase/recombinase XerD
MNTLATHLTDYLALRRSMGHKLDGPARQLPTLVEFCDRTGQGVLTTDLMLRWALTPTSTSQQSPMSSIPSHRIVAARGFARYMAGIDPATEVPAAGLINHHRPRKTPYIYTATEVTALLEAVPRITASAFRADTFRIMIALLSVTGMRIGEILNLKDSDVDRSRRTLLVTESKFGKTRLVPVHETTMTGITRYQRQRNKALPNRKASNVLLSMAGTAVFYSDACATFRRIVNTAGVGAGARRPPRMHDFRHTFAVRTLLRWYATGQDVTAKLPVLATYLGHRDPTSTYWYLSATPELLAHAVGMLEDTGKEQS